jgi:hypothetical protein
MTSKALQLGLRKVAENMQNLRFKLQHYEEDLQGQEEGRCVSGGWGNVDEEGGMQGSGTNGGVVRGHCGALLAGSCGPSTGVILPCTSVRVRLLPLPLCYSLPMPPPLTHHPQPHHMHPIHSACPRCSQGNPMAAASLAMMRNVVKQLKGSLYCYDASIKQESLLEMSIGFYRCRRGGGRGRKGGGGGHSTGTKKADIEGSDTRGPTTAGLPTCSWQSLGHS